MRAVPFFAVLSILLAAVVAGCTSPAGPGLQFAHVHGLAYDPASGALFVATHHGLVRGDAKEGAWSWAYVGEKRYDLMGFSQDGADSTVFYAGGHPGLLGLARSKDAGVTWTSQSYEGKADIHALTGIPGKGDAVVAWWNGMPLLSSTDGGRTWADLAAVPMGVAALAASADTLYVGTPDGLQISKDGGRTLTPAKTPAAGAITAIGASRDGELVFATVSGDTDTDTVQGFQSTDQGNTWNPLASPGLQGVPYSLVYASDGNDPGHAFAATYGGHVEETRDSGATWTTIRA